MKKAIAFIFAFIALVTVTQAQNAWLISVPSGGWTKPNNSFGDIRNRATVDKFLGIPTISTPPVGLAETTDLLHGGLAWCTSDHQLYVWHPETSEWLAYGAGAGTTVEFQTNGVDNGVQNFLNLMNGSGIQVTEDGSGNVTFDALPIGSLTWSVLDALGTAPGTPADGDAYLVTSPGTGFSPVPVNHIATWDATGGVWVDGVPSIGDLLYNDAGTTVYKWTGSNWIPVSPALIYQGGNSYGVAIAIGSNDAKGLRLKTNGVVRISISQTGNVTFNSLTGTGDALMGLDATGLASRTTIGTGLSLVGGVLSATGTVPNLQQVTDVGSVTTHRIDLENSGWLIYSTSGTSRSLAAGLETATPYMKWTIGSGNGYLRSTNITTTTRNLELPNNSGTLAVAVKANGTTYNSGTDGVVDIGTLSVTETQNWQQTLDISSTLNKNNTIIGAGFDYSHNGIGTLSFVGNTGGDSLIMADAFATTWGTQPRLKWNKRYMQIDTLQYRFPTAHTQTFNGVGGNGGDGSFNDGRVLFDTTGDGTLVWKAIPFYAPPTATAQTFFGWQSGGQRMSNGTGSLTFFGYNNFPIRTGTSNNNTAIGVNIARVATTAGSIDAMGVNTLFKLTTGVNNTAIGTYTLNGVTTQSNNVAVGAGAFGTDVNNSGRTENGPLPTNSIALGINAGNGPNVGNWTSTPALTNSIFIGRNAGGTLVSTGLDSTTIFGNFMKTALNNVFILGGATQKVIIPNNTLTVTSNTTAKLQTPSFSTGLVQKSANYALGVYDHSVEFTSTATGTLPSAVGIAGFEYYVANSGSGTLTLNTTSSQQYVNVSGTPTFLTISGAGAVQLQSNGTGWLVMASSGSGISGGGGGAVSSVGLVMPSIFTVSNSPVVSAGNLTAAYNNAQGDIPIGSATNTVTWLNKSTSATRYLANTGTNNNPQWDQVNLTNGVTGFLPVGNIVSSSNAQIGATLRGNGSWLDDPIWSYTKTTMTTAGTLALTHPGYLFHNYYVLTAGSTIGSYTITFPLSGLGCMFEFEVDQDITALTLSGSGGASVSTSAKSSFVKGDHIFAVYDNTTFTWYISETDKSAGGGGSGTVNSGTANRLAYYASTGTAVSELAAMTANRVVLTDANGLPISSSITNTTLGYLDATSSIQTQLNTKLDQTAGDARYFQISNNLSEGTAGAMRTNLGGTTIGQNVFTQTNPSAITFPRYNADNTVSALSASAFRTAIGAGTGSGNGDLLSTNNLSDLTNFATARTNLGATTVGNNIFTATNPSAVRWIRINADNSVSFRTAAETAGDIGALTSYTETDPTLATWAGSTNITTLGTIGTGTWNGTAIADAYIASAATWNAKQNAITTGTTAQYFRGDFSLATFPTALSNFSNDLANLTATDATLTFSGAYNGSTARTVGLNLGNANTWTANQTAPNFIQGYTTTATAAGTTTLTVNSTYNQFFTGSTTQTVALPVVSTLQLGTQYYIVNNSTGDVTVQSSGGNTVITVAGLTRARLTSIATSGTTAASWSYTYEPVIGATGKYLALNNSMILAGTDGQAYTMPTTSQDIVGATSTQTLTNKTIDAASNTISNIANANVASGAAIDATKINTGAVSNTEFNYLDNVTSAIQTQLNAKSDQGRTTVSDANYTVLSTDKYVTYTSITAARTVTLPAANSVSAGKEVIIGDESGSVTAAITITVQRAGSDAIQGAGITGNTRTISSAYGVLKLISDGTSKWTISGGLVAYQLEFTAAQDAAPADGATQALGLQSNQTLASTAKVYIPQSGTIIKAVLWISEGGVGSNEAGTAYIRVNNTTDYTVSTALDFSSQQKVVNNSLSIPVVGDYTDFVAFKVVYPTWATNPTNVRYTGVVWVQQ